MSDSVRPHRWQPTRLPHPWDSPGKNTGVGCHFLLQCMKEKSESEVTQSCPTLSDHMDCSLPGSSIHGIFQARVLEWGAIAFSRGWSTSPKSQSLKMGEKGLRPVSGTKVTSRTYAAVTGCPWWTWGKVVFRVLGICGSPRPWTFKANPFFQYPGEVWLLLE